MPLKNNYDIIVAGAGIAGISAAVSAGSRGARVLLIEHYPFLGGMSAAGMVSPFMKSETGGISLVNGIFESLEQGMRGMGGMIDNGFYAWAFRSVAHRLLDESKVDIAFNTDLVAVTRDGKKVVSVDLATPSGKRTVSGKYFIDTTGDAQLAFLGDFSWEKGDVNEGKLQALTLFFRMGGIDVRKTARWASLHKEEFLAWMDFRFDFNRIISIAGYKNFIRRAQQEGRLSKDIEYIFFTTLPVTGEGSFNTTNIRGIDPSDSASLTQAEMIGHEQVAQVVDLLNSEVPGFENAYLIDTGVQVGVRETRRAVADYMMTGDDVMTGARFPDPIARGCYGIDIHGQKQEDNALEDLTEGEWYEIPLRSLLIRDAENLMVAGRCIGATREGHSALRIMPTSAATGEACGVATALACKTGTDLRKLSYEEIRKELLHNLESH